MGDAPAATVRRARAGFACITHPTAAKLRNQMGDFDDEPTPILDIDGTRRMLTWLAEQQTAAMERDPQRRSECRIWLAAIDAVSTLLGEWTDSGEPGGSPAARAALLKLTNVAKTPDGG